MAFSMGFSFRGPWGPGQTIFWSRWTEFHLSNWLLSVIDSKRFFYMDYYTGNIWENLKYIPGKKRWIGIINMDKNDELSSMLVMEIHHWYIPNYWYIYILYQNKYVYIYIPTIFFPPTARPVFLWSRHVPQKQRPPTHIWAPNDGRMQLQSNQDEGIRNLPKALHLSGKLPSGQRLIQWTGLRENWNRKAPYLMGKSMVSCKCSLKPIQSLKGILDTAGWTHR